MATLDGVRVTIQIEGTSYDSGSGVNGAKVELDRRVFRKWVQGTGSGQVDKVFQDILTLSTTPTDLDLDSGSNVKDPASQDDQDFTKLHGLIVVNEDDTDSITVMGDSNSVPVFDDASDEITLAPGEAFVWMAKTGTDGVDVTASTGDIVQLVASANTPDAFVFAWGR